MSLITIRLSQSLNSRLPVLAFALTAFFFCSCASESYEGWQSCVEPVDLGLSVQWASCNLGATKPHEFGLCFAWGEVKGQRYLDAKWSGGGFYDIPDCEVDSVGVLSAGNDPACVLLGQEWRMPTHEEFQELLDNCVSEWTADYEGSGIAGRIFTSRIDGYTERSIFLPAVGYGEGDILYNSGYYSYYWSSSVSELSNAWALFFGSAFQSTYGDAPRFNGRPVRAVRR